MVNTIGRITGADETRRISGLKILITDGGEAEHPCPSNIEMQYISSKSLYSCFMKRLMIGYIRALARNVSASTSHCDAFLYDWLEANYWENAQCVDHQFCVICRGVE